MPINDGKCILKEDEIRKIENYPVVENYKEAGEG